MQSVSNGIEFDGSKEDYMLRLNPFIKRNRLYVNVFFDNLTVRKNNILLLLNSKILISFFLQNADSIEQQRAQQAPLVKKPFRLSKDELAEIENEIFKGISNSKDKMLALLSSQSVRVSYTDHDSDDENSAVEVDEI